MKYIGIDLTSYSAGSSMTARRFVCVRLPALLAPLRRPRAVQVGRCMIILHGRRTTRPNTATLDPAMSRQYCWSSSLPSHRHSSWHGNQRSPHKMDGDLLHMRAGGISSRALRQNGAALLGHRSVSHHFSRILLAVSRHALPYRSPGVE